MSYANMLMYGAVIPSTDIDDKKRSKGVGREEEEILWADDPKNRQRAIEMIQQMV